MTKAAMSPITADDPHDKKTKRLVHAAAA